MSASWVCLVCGGGVQRELGVRSDGVRVVACCSCGMGVVEQMPDDIAALYADDYYGVADDSAVGYSEYAFTAEHSLAWVSALVRLLAPSGGRILDIGCADGWLLERVSQADPWRCFGIEANADMAQTAGARGIQVLSSDLYAVAEPELLGTFDVVCGMAVFEHLVDIKRAVQLAANLMAPDGLLVFEVPLLEASSPDDVWLTSSLEHIWYPTEASLRWLVEESLGLNLSGAECRIATYGSTYVGVITKAPAQQALADDAVHRILNGPIRELTSVQERRVRFLYEVVHAASTHNTEAVEFLGGLQIADVTPALLRRLSELWARDVADRDRADASAEQWRVEAQAQMRLLEEHSKTTRKLLSDVEAITAARDWHAGESARWMGIALDLTAAINNQQSPRSET